MCLGREINEISTPTARVQCMLYRGGSDVASWGLMHVHSPCIPGEEKTMSRLRERFYWPGQWNDVRDWCRTCATCAARKTAAPKQRAPLQTIPAGYPLQVVAMDILGPLPESESGNSYILVVGDYFTR